MLGGEARKHPSFGKGVFVIARRHSSWLVTTAAVAPALEEGLVLATEGVLVADVPSGAALQPEASVADMMRMVV